MGTLIVYLCLAILVFLVFNGLLLAKAGEGQEMIDQINRDDNETS